MATGDLFDPALAIPGATNVAPGKVTLFGRNKRITYTGRKKPLTG
jgi:hypothetical protein